MINFLIIAIGIRSKSQANRLKQLDLIFDSSKLQRPAQNGIFFWYAWRIVFTGIVIMGKYQNLAVLALEILKYTLKILYLKWCRSNFRLLCFPSDLKTSNERNYYTSQLSNTARVKLSGEWTMVSMISFDVHHFKCEIFIENSHFRVGSRCFIQFQCKQWLK